MVTELQILGLLIATVFGSLTSWYLGWKEVGGDFDFSKASPSIIRAVIAAIVIFVATYTGYVGDANLFTYLLAYLAGLGIDAGGNRLSGAIAESRRKV